MTTIQNTRRKANDLKKIIKNTIRINETKWIKRTRNIKKISIKRKKIKKINTGECDVDVGGDNYHIYIETHYS